MSDSEYLSVHKGSKVDEAVTTVRNNDCQVKYGNFIGSINDQTDLQSALDAKVDETVTINGHALNTSTVTLVPNDLNAADNNMSNLTSTGISSLRTYCLSTTGGTVSGNETITGNLAVGGTTTMTGALTVNNAVAATSVSAGSVTSTGAITVSGSGNYLLLQNANVNSARIQLPTTGEGIEVKSGDGSAYASVKCNNLNVTGKTTMTGALTVNNSINGITAEEFSCLDNVSSNIQTQLDNRYNLPRDIIIFNNWNATSGTKALTNNRVHWIRLNGTTTFSLPSVDNTKFNQMLVIAAINGTYTINWGTSHYFNNMAPNVSTAGRYTIVYEHDATYWFVGAIYKGAL